jgi:hypothetical protein
MIRLEFPERKRLRARVVSEYALAAGYRECICFSCGHASAALAEFMPTFNPCEAGLDHWYTPEEIHRRYLDRFDATSGHLPLFLMQRLAERFYYYLAPLDQGTVVVPSGSGETILCLKLAYPAVNFVAEYDNNKPWLRYEESAPLNAVVGALCQVVHIKENER